MRGQPTTRPDVLVAALAARQHGVVDHAELRACGLSDDQITRRIATGRLHPLHRGVYAVGHGGVSLPGRLLAAAKAAGDGAVVSHFGAAVLHCIIEWNEDWVPEVTRRGATPSRHPRLFVHRTIRLEPIDVTVVDGIPVTTPARTIVDLAARMPAKLLRRLVRQALAAEKVTIRELVATLARLRPCRGSARLARVLADAVPTRSELEDVVLDLILSGGFDPPTVNAPLRIGGRTVIPDFRWAAQRLVVEADGRRYHDNPIARADDARRQAMLEAAGERVVRVTWRQAVARPGETLARIAAAGAPSGGLTADSAVNPPLDQREAA